jgi:hypothetical protein
LFEVLKWERRKVWKTEAQNERLKIIFRQMVLDFVALSGLGRHVGNFLEKVLLGLHCPSRHLPLDTRLQQA